MGDYIYNDQTTRPTCKISFIANAPWWETDGSLIRPLNSRERLLYERQVGGLINWGQLAMPFALEPSPDRLTALQVGP